MSWNACSGRTFSQFFRFWILRMIKDLTGYTHSENTFRYSENTHEHENSFLCDSRCYIDEIDFIMGNSRWWDRLLYCDNNSNHNGLKSWNLATSQIIFHSNSFRECFLKWKFVNRVMWMSWISKGFELINGSASKVLLDENDLACFLSWPF